MLFYFSGVPVYVRITSAWVRTRWTGEYFLLSLKKYNLNSAVAVVPVPGSNDVMDHRTDDTFRIKLCLSTVTFIYADWNVLNRWEHLDHIDIAHRDVQRHKIMTSETSFVWCLPAIRGSLFLRDRIEFMQWRPQNIRVFRVCPGVCVCSFSAWRLWM